MHDSPFLNAGMDQIKAQASRIRLSKDGPDCSRIVAGVMKWGSWGKGLSTEEMHRLIDRCLALGISTFDHADIYGGYSAEAEFGRALSRVAGRRKMIQLVSKCGIRLKSKNRPSHKIKSYDTSAEHIIRSVEESLKNLQTDYLDLFLIHRPSPLMDADEIASAFHRLKIAGKVLHFGVSNFTPAQFALLNDRFPLVTNQIQVSALHLEPFLDGSLDQAQQHRISPMAWSPVGGAKMFDEAGNERISRLRAKVQEIAGHYRVEEEQVLLAFLLRHPSKIIPVMGTTRVDRLQAAVEAEQVVLSRESWFEIWEASVGQEVP